MCGELRLPSLIFTIRDIRSTIRDPFDTSFVCVCECVHLVSLTTFSHFLPLVQFIHILIYTTMSNLLSDTDIAFRSLQQDRRDLIIKILKAQKGISDQITKLEKELDRNVFMLRELADDVDAFDASLDKKGGMNISMADVSNKPEGVST